MWWRITAPNCRESVLEAGLSPTRKIASRHRWTGRRSANPTVIAVPCCRHLRAAGRLISGSVVHPIGGIDTMNLMEWICPSRTVEAHCDLPCGIYDPEQARIEAESVYNIIKKYNDSKDEVYRQRAIIIKEKQAELAKHHLDVLWSDWYKPEKHDAKFPELKDALKTAVTQGSKVKSSVDLAEAQKFLDLIDKVDQIWEKAGGPQETRVARSAATPTRA